MNPPESTRIIADNGRYHQRVALVSGAGSGIGLAMTERLLAEGALVCATDINTTALEGLDHGNLAIVNGDITDGNTVNRAVARARELADGGIDALFNNAGISASAPAAEVSFAQWRKVMDVNLDAAFRLAQAAGQVMIERGHGAILNTASPAGIAGITNSIAYVASKHAIIGLTRGLAVEWGPLGVRVNAICPGLTETGMNETFRTEHPQRWASREKINPLRRAGHVQEQAATALFLNSTDASYTTGQIAVVDGGQDALYSGYTVAFR